MNIIVEMGSIIIQISSNTDTLISHAAAFQSMNPDDSLADILSESAITAIVDKDKESNESYRPKLIYNDFEKKIKSAHPSFPNWTNANLSTSPLHS